MADFPDYAQFANSKLIDELYAKYSRDPKSVDPSWRHFFEGLDFNKAATPAVSAECRVMKLIYAYRKYGHLMVAQNPIAPPPEFPPELSLEKLGFSSAEESSVKDLIASLQSIYGSRIGFEYMDLDNPKMEAWIQSKIEPLNIQLSAEEKQFLLSSLSQAESFETFIHTKYVGQKRFSIEGAETLIPILEEMVDYGSQMGVEQLIIGMAHRGRLNVLANILKKPYSVIFQEFEDSILPTDGSGDVKYHKGFSSDIQSRFGQKLHLHLAANSSCLESVDPVALGVTRAKQVLLNDEERKKVGCILIHGDASISGQGVVYESLELMRLPGYSTGGTIHIVVNNQIGFTTLPEEGRSTRYCTDIAKAFGCPVFHVNAEDPESCLFVAKLAVELRLLFQCDVFIDLNCYRKYGHNEGDEPAFTQPGLYKIIRAKQTIRELYAQKEGVQSGDAETKFRSELDEALKRGKEEKPHAPEERYGIAWASFKQPDGKALLEPFDSKATSDLLRKAAEGYCTIPADFHLHPKLQKWVEDRRAMVQPNGTVDWGMAECLAFGSLLLEEVPIRLAGQDSRRGTFSQRHAVWVDQENDSLYFPYSHLDAKQARFDVYNSPLSEFACLAFEYGYTWATPKGLVLWEAQYGDFSIGAQTVIDHYITTAEQKWARYSSLVLLLPHGYEGQGPEHSSARMERFLQLAALNNTQIANLTTPAQYFHILRRQALRPIKKPLIVFTPKSLLRLPACVSPFQDFTDGQFQEILDDPTPPEAPKKVLLCSGRVYYDLVIEREKRKSNVAIVRIEQLYPLHVEKLNQVLSRYKNAEYIWVQDEPQNMGAWDFLRSQLQIPLRYVGRERSPVTATGSHKQHKIEQDRFLNEAFS